MDPRFSRDLANLKELSIIDNSNLEKIRRKTFKQLVKVERIDFSGCVVSEIEPGTFSSLQKLKNLNLTKNSLIKIPSSEDLQNIEHLNLSENRIGSIGHVFIQKNTRLIMLDLSGNRLTELPANSFLGLGALRSLNFAHNEHRNSRRCICWFSELDQLRKSSSFFWLLLDQKLFIVIFKSALFVSIFNFLFILRILHQ